MDSVKVKELYYCFLKSRFKDREFIKDKITHEIIEHILYRDMLEVDERYKNIEKDELIIFLGDEEDLAKELYETGVFGECTGLIDELLGWTTILRILQNPWTNPFEYYEVYNLQGSAIVVYA